MYVIEYIKYVPSEIVEVILWLELSLSLSEYARAHLRKQPIVVPKQQKDQEESQIKT